MCDKQSMAAICDCHYYRGHLSGPAKGFNTVVVSVEYSNGSVMCGIAVQCIMVNTCSIFVFPCFSLFFPFEKLANTNA